MQDNQNMTTTEVYHPLVEKPALCTTKSVYTFKTKH